MQICIIYTGIFSFDLKRRCTPIKKDTKVGARSIWKLKEPSALLSIALMNDTQLIYLLGMARYRSVLGQIPNVSDHPYPIGVETLEWAGHMRAIM